MGLDYPTRYEDISRWANQESVSVAEAGRRYAQYLILYAICQSNPLRQALIFKGGNALDFVYQSNRSTIDLDFSLLHETSANTTLQDSLRRQIKQSIESVNDGFNTVLRLQSLRQNPPGENMQFPTITAKIAYALPEQSRQRILLESGKPGANVIPVEMSVNEIVCSWEAVNIGRSVRELQVATIEDIVAEKLRAILQQVVRNRHRNQDVLDIAVICGNANINVDAALIADFLIQKSASRNIVTTKSSFHNAEIRMRASTGYDNLARTVRKTFIPFDEAWEAVLTMVESLDIPD